MRRLPNTWDTEQAERHQKVHDASKPQMQTQKPPVLEQIQAQKPPALEQIQAQKPPAL
jgi:hypothetical protein